MLPQEILRIQKHAAEKVVVTSYGLHSVAALLIHFVLF